MTTILAVDLAAKLSAVIQRGPGGEVLAQFDSRGKTRIEFCRQVSRAAAESDLIVIEDVPYGISNQAMVKPVLRLQGALEVYLTAVEAIERSFYMIPSVWMKEFPGVMNAPRGMTKAAGDKHRIEEAARHAREAGYEPPDLVAEYVKTLPEGAKVLKKNTNILEKSMTDYVSAFLISEYVRMFDRAQLAEMRGVEPA